MVMDWLWGLLGGLCIGTAAAGYLLVNGRIMGASGIVGELVDGTAGPTGREKASFLVGLVVVPGLAALAAGGAATHLTDDWRVIVIAGLLVGLGTRMANGCTSGHGVCGLSRLSLRGLVATVCYLLAGAVVMAALRHGLGAI